MTTKQQFTAKTLDEALDEAAKFFGVDRIALSYETQNAGSGGLLSKLFSRNIRIEAWVEEKKDLKQAARDAVRAALGKDSGSAAKPESKKQQQDSSNSQQPNRAPQQKPKHQNQHSRPQQNQSHSRPQNKEQRAPRPPREHAPDRQMFSFDSPGVKEIFEEFAERFNQVFEVPKGKLEQAEGQIRLLMNSDFLETTLAKTDRLSSAFEHVFKRIAQKKIGDVADRIIMEAGASAERRHEHLKEMALSIADKVKRTGRAITLAAKSAAERRVIHLSLDGQDGVATKSVGSGDERKLIIFSTNPEHKQPRRRRGGRGRGGQQQAGERSQGGFEGSSGSDDQSDAKGVNTETSARDQRAEGQGRRRRRSRNRRGRGGGASAPHAHEQGGAHAASEDVSTASADE